MRLGAAAALAASVALLGGCGGEAGDLMSIEVSGGPTAEKHTLVVTGDGRGSCDRGKEELLPSDRVIEARGIADDIGDLATKAAEYPTKAGARRFKLSTKDGDVRWSEGTRGLPSVLPRGQLLAAQLESELCG